MKIVKKIRKVKNGKGYKIHYDKPCARIEFKGDKKIVEWLNDLLESKVNEYFSEDYEFE
jgi:hypothetical protein